jgi:hypothetical protein
MVLFSERGLGRARGKEYSDILEIKTNCHLHIMMPKEAVPLTIWPMARDEKMSPCNGIGNIIYKDDILPLFQFSYYFFWGVGGDRTASWRPSWFTWRTIRRSRWPLLPGISCTSASSPRPAFTSTNNKETELSGHARRPVHRWFSTPEAVLVATNRLWYSLVEAILSG